VALQQRDLNNNKRRRIVERWHIIMAAQKVCFKGVHMSYLRKEIHFEFLIRMRET